PDTTSRWFVVLRVRSFAWTRAKHRERKKEFRPYRCKDANYSRDPESFLFAFPRPLGEQCPGISLPFSQCVSHSAKNSLSWLNPSPGRRRRSGICILAAPARRPQHSGRERTNSWDGRISAVYVSGHGILGLSRTTRQRFGRRSPCDCLFLSRSP